MVEHFSRLGRADEFHCPQLPASPALAIEQLIDLIERHHDEKLCLIGSSLGGFYATFLAEKFSCRAILINPAVKPPRDLEKYVGVTTAYHSDEEFEFTQEHVAELKRFCVDKISHPERYFLLAATGDEVLDWREMVAHYPGAAQHIIQGSDHGVNEFADYLEMVMAWGDSVL